MDGIGNVLSLVVACSNLPEAGLCSRSAASAQTRVMELSLDHVISHRLFTTGDVGAIGESGSRNRGPDFLFSSAEVGT